jgi:hypothetical protein
MTEKLKTIYFIWHKSNTISRLTLHNKTWEEALTMAKGMGFVECKGYLPRTWNNFCRIENED